MLISMIRKSLKWFPILMRQTAKWIDQCQQEQRKFMETKYIYEEPSFLFLFGVVHKSESPSQVGSSLSRTSDELKRKKKQIFCCDFASSRVNWKISSCELTNNIYDANYATVEMKMLLSLFYCYFSSNRVLFVFYYLAADVFELRFISKARFLCVTQCETQVQWKNKRFSWAWNW